MSTLTTEEQETANVLREASLADLSGANLDLQSLGFKDNVMSENGIETARVLNDIHNVAYKVKNNASSDLSKAQAKMNDSGQRYGRASSQYDSAQEKYEIALAEVEDATRRYEMTKNTKNAVGSAITRGLTL